MIHFLLDINHYLSVCRVFTDNWTSDINKVTCGNCLRTKEYQKSKKEVEKEEYDRENESYERARARGWAD